MSLILKGDSFKCITHTPVIQVTSLGLIKPSAAIFVIQNGPVET